MAKANEETQDQPSKLWGVSVETWGKLFQQVGVPTVFMVFICWVFYQWLPPMAAAHIDLLRRTGETMESMDETLTQSNKMLEKLADQQYPAQEFRDKVFEEHDKAQSTLDEIKAGVDKLNGA